MNELKLILVGAGGRVGRLLIPAFEMLGAKQHVVLSHRGAAGMAGGGPELIWDPTAGDVPLSDWTGEHGVPDAMLVLAGSTPSTGSDMARNIEVAQAVQTAARKAGIKRILLASSSAVYGRGRPQAWQEADLTEPTNAYGKAKLAMELACAGPDTCALRIGNVAGADALLTNPARPLVIHRFADAKGQPHGPRRSYIGPQSFARVVLALSDLSQPLPSVLNLATPEPVDMADLAQAADLPWGWQDAPTGAIGNLTLDCAALAAICGFDPSESRAEMLVGQWKSCRTQAGS